MSKRNYKIKPKKATYVVSLCLLISIAVVVFIGYKMYSNNSLKQLKTNYSQYIITTKKTKLYDKNNKIIGSITSNYYLELVKINNLTLKNKHLQIKNTNYYISYKDIKKTDKRVQKKEVNNSYYLDLNKTLKTNSSVTLMKDNKKILTLNKGITTNIKSIDDNYYYVDFLNDTFQIKKSKALKVEDNKKEQDNSYVSVILYNKINTDCNEDTCFNPNSIKAHINRLKKEGYYFITLDDYLKYIKGYVNLKEKAVLLITNEENEFTKNITKETSVTINVSTKDMKYTNSNKKSTNKDTLSNINNYYPKKYMVIDEYLKMANGQDITDDGGKDTATEIAVVNYHFFFSSELNESCNESICLDTKKFEEQLKWLQDNNYKTLTINEFADWKDGYIELPSKSVLLTIDDGAMGTGKHNGNKLIPLLEKYKQHATLFLITGWWELGNYQSPYLDVQSHTHNLHFEARCADGRGMVACSDYKTVKSDLEESLKVLNDRTSFCFPFYSYDKESLQALEELNFRVAFIGGNVKTNRKQNNLLITRYPILNDITLQDFINMVE